MAGGVSRDPAGGRSQSAKAHEAILARIVSGDLAMGSALREADMAGALGTGRREIREALASLEREGLVAFSDGHIWRVFDMCPAEISDLGEVRAMLEREALVRAGRRGPEALARRLDTIVAQMRDALDRSDAEGYRQLDHAFHAAILESSGSGVLAATYRVLSVRIQALRSRLSEDPARDLRSLTEHMAIREALAERDLDRAISMLAEHVGEATRNHLDRIETASSAATGTDGEETVRIDLHEMERFSTRALRAAGADAETVAAVNRTLLHASTLGVDTHGFRLLPHYLAAFLGGRINGAPQMRVVSRKGGAALLDADNAHGAPATCTAAEMAVEMAREHGIAAVAIRNSSHFGAAGAYALQIARQGMMGLAFCNSDAFVRLHGGADRFHGTNPIAAAAPVPDGDPWLLDMATSSVPYNRVRLSRSLGVPLPADVASDLTGANVTDPDLAEMLAPLGGALFGFKGAGLAGLSEILSSAFADAPLSFELPAMVSDDMRTPRRLGAFVMALDPDAFSGASAFAAVMRRYVGALRESTSSPGQSVMAPGDREWKEAAARRVAGLKLDTQSVESLGEFARAHGIETLRPKRARVEM
ncbi:Ldh family oxidoreductase [Sulfitobacter sp. LCG007]